MSTTRVRLLIDGCLTDSLFSLSNSKPLPVDDRLFSPYSNDEAVDVESLYLSLCARRRARGVPTDLKPTEFAELFLQPGKEEVVNAEDGNRWTAFLDSFLWLLE